ncbi:MAG: DUF1552 domain-containing protein [Deltaproteobacteria bacterium]|nr:DUF1552 domain-containing protein [Nannocystaceae bacterium]
MGNVRLPRRTFLRGLGGTAIALPLLDAMLNDNGTALAGGAAIPLRYAICFGGFPLGCDSGPQANNFVPAATGPGYALGPAIAPLGDYDNVAERITLVSGLSIPSQTEFGGPIPPGGRGINFHAHTNPIFTGTASLPPLPGESLDYRVSNWSSDQIVADAIAGDTSFKSLQYRAQALLYNSGVGAYYRDLMSWRMDGSEPAPLYPVASPRQAYDTLFLGFVPDDPAEAAAKAFEIAKRKSVLDLVDRRMNGMLDRLGAADRIRLEQHYDAIRHIENALDNIPPDQTGACMLLRDPGEDPPLGGAFTGDDPDHYDVNAGYSGEQTRIRVFSDLIHMAFVCDLTRVVTFMSSMIQCFMNVEPITGDQYALHSMTHSGQTYELNRSIAWHMDHFAYLVAKLRDTPEGDGSLLDSCAITYLIEAGGGYSYENGSAFSAHSTDNMAMLVAGGAGGLVQGEHIVAPASANHTANVLISAMHAVGVEEDLGDVEGPIPALFG